MSEAKGRAGFKAVHTKVGGKYPGDKKTGTPSTKGGSNLAIAKEALRSLDAAQSAREAMKNPYILVTEEQLNENWVSDGVGGLKTATRFEEVEKSLAARNAQLYRKQASKDYELSLLVVHLPENMCMVDPVNASYVMRKLEDGSEEQVISEATGEPLTKPRLIPRDADEARRYFDDALAFMVEHGLIAGGMDALHFRSDQYSEHRPHMQVGFDNYVADPKHPGHLRTFHGETWFTHDTVCYPDGHPKAGKKIGGAVKLSNYQEQMREFMIAKGWPVEKDINEKTKGNSQGKDLYAATDDARIIAEDRLAAAEAQEAGNEQEREWLTRNGAKMRAARDKVEADREDVAVTLAELPGMVAQQVNEASERAYADAYLENIETMAIDRRETRRVLDDAKRDRAAVEEPYLTDWLADVPGRIRDFRDYQKLRALSNSFETNAAAVIEETEKPPIRGRDYREDGYHSF